MKAKEYNQLTKKEQGDIVANLCGWENHDFDGKFCWISPRGGQMWSEGRPDYLNDLNACHEFEIGLNVKQQEIYANELYLQIGPWTGRRLHYHLASATAKQKCKAYVLTMTEDDS
jgi:hypothetical protein